MIGPAPIICEAPGCTLVRTPTKHWFAVRVLESGKIEVYPWEVAVAAKVLRKTSHFCGQTHALQFVSAKMGTKQSVRELDEEAL